jgi:hypothetical protein
MKKIFLGIFIALSAQLHAQVLNDGFENWTQVVDTFLPDGWKASINWIGSSRVVKQTPALTEGNYSVTIVDSVFGFEGPLDFSISKRTLVFTDTVDITFNYKCVGQGFCKVWLGQAVSDTSAGYNQREVWSVSASSDTSTHTANIQSVGVNPPFNGFAVIGLKSSPVTTPLQSYGITHFTIDAFSASSNVVLSVEETTKETGWTIQNPVQHVLRIFSPRNEVFTSIRVFNSVGELMTEVSNSRSADVSKLPSGFYLIEVSNGKQVEFFKIIKY